LQAVLRGENCPYPSLIESMDEDSFCVNRPFPAKAAHIVLDNCEDTGVLRDNFTTPGCHRCCD
jgi:hypothetical protein